MLRNTINYKIGVGYKAIDGKTYKNLELFLKKIKNYSTLEIVTNIENIKFKIAKTSLINAIEKYSELMILFGTLISRLLFEYRDSIWEHREIKFARSTQREKYLNNFGLTMNELWPK